MYIDTSKKGEERENRKHTHTYIEHTHNQHTYIRKHTQTHTHTHIHTHTHTHTHTPPPLQTVTASLIPWAGVWRETTLVTGQPVRIFSGCRKIARASSRSFTDVCVLARCEVYESTCARAHREQACVVAEVLGRQKENKRATRSENAERKFLRYIAGACSRTSELASKHARTQARTHMHPSYQGGL
jgi:hypothetical protein